MEREPASDIITGAGSPSPRIDATSFHIKRKRRQNKRLAVLGARAKARKTIVELTPKIMPKPRPRPRIPVPDAILVIDLTADPHSSYHVMDLTGVCKTVCEFCYYYQIYMIAASTCARIHRMCARSSPQRAPPIRFLYITGVMANTTEIPRLCMLTCRTRTRYKKLCSCSL